MESDHRIDRFPHENADAIAAPHAEVGDEACRDGTRERRELAITERGPGGVLDRDVRRKSARRLIQPRGNAVHERLLCQVAARSSLVSTGFVIRAIVSMFSGS